MEREKDIIQPFSIDPLIFLDEEEEKEKVDKNGTELKKVLYFLEEGSRQAEVYEEQLKIRLEGKIIKPFVIEGENETRRQTSELVAKTTPQLLQNNPVPSKDLRMVKANELPKILTFSIDDIGNVERVFHTFGEIILFNPNSGKFYLWNGKVWKADEVRGVKKMCEKAMEEYRDAAKPYRYSGDDYLQERFRHSQQSCNNNRLNALVDMLKHGTAKVSQDLDRYPYLLNVKNGVLSLHDGQLQNHDKNLLLTQYVDVDYVVNAHIGSRFEAFVHSICGGDQLLVGYLQKVLGYAITGETKEQSLFLLYGSGSNGKTTLLEAIDSIFSDYTHHIPIAVLLESAGINQAGRPSPELAQAVNSRILFCSESNENDYLNEGKIKMLTGESTISVRNLYCEPFEMKPKFKMLIDTNHLPKIRGRDFAIWRRLKVIPFTQTFKGKAVDRYLPQKLKSRREQEAILAYYKEGLHDIPAITDAASAYQHQYDTIRNFLEEGVEYDKSFNCSGSELYEAYRAFCTVQELEAVNLKTFGCSLSENGYQKVRVSSGMQYRGIRPKV